VKANPIHNDGALAILFPSGVDGSDARSLAGTRRWLPVRPLRHSGKYGKRRETYVPFMVRTKHKVANAGPDPSGTIVRSGPKKMETFYIVCLTGHREGRRMDVIRWIRKNWKRLGGSMIDKISLEGGPTLKIVSDIVDYAVVRKIMEEKETFLTGALEEKEMNQLVMELTDVGALTKEIPLHVPSKV
jgi:hypothetical protein